MSVAFSFIGLIIPVLVVLVIVGFVTRSGSGEFSQERGEEMVKTLYHYIVLFVTLMMMIGGSVAAFMAASDIIAPAPYYQTYRDFKEMKRMENTKYDRQGEPIPQAELNEAEIKKEYEAIREQEMTRARDNALNTLVKSFGWILIPAPVFLYFKKRVGEGAKA